MDFLPFRDADLDMIAACLGILIGSIMVFVGTLKISSIIPLGIIVLFGCVAYLHKRRHYVSDIVSHCICNMGNSVGCGRSKTTVYILNICFSLCVLGIIYDAYNCLYTKSLLYFVSITGMALLIATDIYFSTKESRCLTTSIFVKIILLGIALRFFPYYEFPGYIGADAWRHDLLANIIQTTYHTPQPTGDIYSAQTQYSYFPLFHVYIAITSILTGLSTKDALIFSIGLLEVISILFIYLIAKKLSLNHQIALLAALLVCINYHHVRWGYWIIPTTVGLILIPAILFIMLKQVQHPKTANTILLIIIPVTIVLTHTITAVILTLICLILYAGVLTFNHLSLKSDPHIVSSNVLLNTAVLIPILTIAYWIYGSIFFQTTIADFLAASLKIDFLIEISTVAQDPFTALIDNLGFYAIFLFALMGTLVFLHSNVMNAQRFAFVLAGNGLTVVIFMAEVAKVSAILPHRWFAFIEFLLAIPMAIGIFVLSHTSNRNHALIAFSCIVALFTISMIITSTANPDGMFQEYNPINTRQSLTEAEITSAETMISKSDEKIGVDRGMSYYFESKDMDYYLTSENLIRSNYDQMYANLLMVRAYIVENPFFDYYGGRRGIVSIDNDVYNELNHHKFHQIYDVKSVKTYFR